MKRLAIILMLLSLFWASPVYADPADPDSVTTENILVARNLLESGDWLVVFEYNVAYAIPPSTKIDKPYLFQLVSTDGTTELGSNTAFPYNDNGYNKGACSLYLTADEVTALSLVWETAYIIRIAQNPAQFLTTPQEWDFPLAADNYCSDTSQSDNQAAVHATVITIAEDLQTAWGITTLVTEGDTGTLLDTLGEYYFASAIRGLRSLCPSLFDVQITDPDYPTTVYGTSKATEYSQRFDNTFVGNGTGSLGQIMNRGAWAGALVMVAGLCLLAVILSVKYTGDAVSGMLCSMYVLEIGALCLPMILVIMAVITFFCLIYVGVSLVSKLL